jgi:uncharacterized protein
MSFLEWILFLLNLITSLFAPLPSSEPSIVPSTVTPVSSPNITPISRPIAVPASIPSAPIPTPLSRPISVPAPIPSAPVTKFVLGSLTAQKDGIRLSQGLTARIIAKTGEFVRYTSPDTTESTSTRRFHAIPDGAAIFELSDGGYVYTSNSEIDNGGGGVYGIEFDKQGRIRDYKPLLTGTDRNCNGGRTPWNTWVSCEEVPGGQCWQVDPTGSRDPEVTVMGGTGGGSFEAFAYDARDSAAVSYYVTEDTENGALRRYRPPRNTPLQWDALHGSGGTLDYLEFLSNNRFRWTTSLSSARSSAATYFPNSEGIAVQNGKLYFVSKVPKLLYTLDLDALTYTVISTKTSTLPGGGIFGDQPDHLLATTSGTLILSEDGGSTPGLFAYDGSKFLSYFESNYNNDEIVGIAFSPDNKFMYAVVQDAGLVFQISRDDGQSFEGRRILHVR